MKVLQVNSLYRRGSTGKIASDIHEELKKRNIESVVCYGRGENWNEPHVHRICNEFYVHINSLWFRTTGIQYGGSILSTSKLIRIIKNEKPNIVHLQILNSAFVNIYRLAKWLKRNKIPTVLTLHAEFMYTGGCGHAFECEQWKSKNGCGFHQKCPQSDQVKHTLFRDKSHTMWKLMNSAFAGWNDDLIIVSVSPWLCNRAKQSPIFEDKIHCVVLNGIDEDNIFHPCDTKLSNSIKKDLGIINDKIVFHPTAFLSSNPEHIKGGYYLIELAKLMPSVKFVVAGNFEDNLSTPANVILLGNINDQHKLAALYSMADLTVLTSKKETFSMVTAESLCCGTPIVGFEAGAPEMIAIKEYSEFVKYGDLEALKHITWKWLNKSINQEDLIEKSNIYSRTVMVENYIKVYDRLYSGN